MIADKIFEVSSHSIKAIYRNATEQEECEEDDSCGDTTTKNSDRNSPLSVFICNLNCLLDNNKFYFNEIINEN